MISIKPKKDTIAKLDKKIKKLQDETKVLLYYGDSKTIQINESIEKSANKIHLLQNKLYNVSFLNFYWQCDLLSNNYLLKQSILHQLFTIIFTDVVKTKII